MIIVKIEGGHSNQLFQYAAGRRLAHRLGVDLYLDLWWFDQIEEIDTPRPYELADYSFPQRFITRTDFALVEDKPDDLKAKIYNLTRGRSKPRIKAYRQVGHGFNEAVLDLPDNTFLDGWWQDERYFKDIRPILLKETELKNKPNARNARWLKEIKDSNSVSIHVRRGDYVTNHLTNKYHGVLPMSYYERALETLVKKTGAKDFKLFVFSNDMEWCKRNIKFKFPTIFVDGHNVGPEDMRLLKHCKHNISANSTFSWWGAWLNQNPEKIVIAPKTWFQHKEDNAATGIVPPEWIRI